MVKRHRSSFNDDHGKRVSAYAGARLEVFFIEIDCYREICTLDSNPGQSYAAEFNFGGVVNLVDIVRIVPTIGTNRP